MKSEIKNIIKQLNPKLFGVKEIKINSFRKLGIGEGNLNYILKINNKEYNCRINIKTKKLNKLKNEFETLKKIEKYGFSPKPIYFHNKPEFSILTFIKGTPFRHGKKTYTKNQIISIAKTLAKLHSVKTTLKPSNYNYGYYLNGAKHLIDELNKRTNNELKPILLNTYKNILKQIPNKENHKYSLIHGDIVPQNIIETTKSIKLIDWENVEVSDPAKDIAQVLIDIEIKGKNLELFLKTYFKIRKDTTILNRAKIYAILMRQNYYIWELIRTLKIKNKELPQEYLNKTNTKQHLQEAKKQLKKLYYQINKKPPIINLTL